MKTLKKYLPILALVLGFSTNVFAQTFVVMQVTIEGSVNGIHPPESTITSITGTYSTPIQTLTVGPDTPNSAGGSSGFTYFDSTGVLTFNLSNFGSSLIFLPLYLFQTFQFDVQINAPSIIIPSQNISTGAFPIPILTVNGQANPVDMGVLSYNDSLWNSGIDPTPPNFSTPPTPSNPINGSPNIAGNIVTFSSPSGGTIGGMLPSSGNESMSIISAQNLLLNSINGNPVNVGMIWEITGCVNPPYLITLNIPEFILDSLYSVTAGLFKISHNGIFYAENPSSSEQQLTVTSGSLDGTSGNGVQIQMTFNSCSPVYLQDGKDEIAVFNSNFINTPQNFNIEQIPNTNDIMLTWDPVIGASGYKVYFGLSLNSLSQPIWVSGNTYIHSNALLTNNKYFYRVTAAN